MSKWTKHVVAPHGNTEHRKRLMDSLNYHGARRILVIIVVTNTYFKYVVRTRLSTGGLLIPQTGSIIAPNLRAAKQSLSRRFK